MSSLQRLRKTGLPHYGLLCASRLGLTLLDHDEEGDGDEPLISISISQTMRPLDRVGTEGAPASVWPGLGALKAVVVVKLTGRMMRHHVRSENSNLLLGRLGSSIGRVAPAIADIYSLRHASANALVPIARWPSPWEERRREGRGEREEKRGEKGGEKGSASH
uniref:Uncharacterized protein n=1 Tax=Oryza barthii TaxID=65489 RepID=A0A0D3H6F7_9ORYZ